MFKNLAQMKWPLLTIYIHTFFYVPKETLMEECDWAWDGE